MPPLYLKGKFVKQNKSYWGTGDNSNSSNSIYTSYTLEVKEVLFGDI
jgi:hypothetical protein